MVLHGLLGLFPVCSNVCMNMDRYKIKIFKIWDECCYKTHEFTFLYKNIEQIENELLDRDCLDIIEHHCLEIWDNIDDKLIDVFDYSGSNWEIKLRNFINELAIKNL